MRRKKKKPTRPPLVLKLRDADWYAVQDLTDRAGATHEQAAGILIAAGADALNNEGRNGPTYRAFVNDSAEAFKLQQHADAQAAQAKTLTTHARRRLATATGDASDVDQDDPPAGILAAALDQPPPAETPIGTPTKRIRPRRRKEAMP